MDEQPVVTRSRRAVTRDPRAYCAKQASSAGLARDLLPHVSLKLPPRRPLAISSELLIRYRLLPASFSAYLPHRPTAAYPMFLSEKSIINNHIMLRHRGLIGTKSRTNGINRIKKTFFTFH